jgi:uncharacterized protein DUF5984
VFWRVADEVFFQWRTDNKADDIPVWSATEGRVCISAADFETEVLRFGNELLACMDIEYARYNSAAGDATIANSTLKSWQKNKRSGVKPSTESLRSSG